MSVRIAPSILAADFADLGRCIAAAERGGAEIGRASCRERV